MIPPSVIYEPDYILSEKGSSHNAFKLHQHQIKNVSLKLRNHQVKVNHLHS